MEPLSKFSVLWKGLLSILLAWFIADRLFFQNNINEQSELFLKNFSAKNMVWLVPLLLLMPLNWWLETYKWKTLLNGAINMRTAWKGVMTGVALGFISPARIGEFAGRIWHLPVEIRTRAFYLSNIGGLAQTAVTIAGGTICVALWANNPFMANILMGISVVFLFLYFRFDLINKLLLKISLLSSNNLTVNIEELPAQSILWKVAGLSVTRYAVYLLQYVLAFRFFGVDCTFVALAVHSGVLLLANSFSPLLPALDFSFRGSVVLFVFAGISQNNIALIAATTLIWLLNLVLPAVTGYLFIVRKEKSV